MIEVRHEGGAWPPEQLVDDAARLLKHADLADAELSVVVCDDRFIQGLNRQWRQLDTPTDVLSFAMGEGEDADLNPDVLGDVVISMTTAARQASEHGHALDVEVRVLLVHGFLHLLGYDHVEPDEAVEMREAEGRLLAMLGAGSTSLIARADAG